MKDWFKKHYVGLGAGIIATIALVAGVKGCNGSERVDEIETRVENLARHQGRTDSIMLSNDSILNAKINNLNFRMSSAESDISDLQDSIAVHREEIDSLKLRTDSLTARVDTIAKRQEKCPCVNPKPAKKPARPNNVPAPVKPDSIRRDTVVIIKEVPVAPAAQNANGCGDDQNANVVIHGNNNTVNISNNGNKSAADTTKTVTRRVVATADATLTINTYVSRQSYCK